jgi:serine/threonine protein kinase
MYSDQRINFKELFVIGSGSYGQVLQLNWVFAIKKLFAVPKEQATKSIRELEIWSQLPEKDRSNVVVFEGLIVPRSLPSDQFELAFVMARYDYTLRDYLEQHESLSPEMQVDILGQISRGLAYLHKNGIIHRDLHSKNVLIKVKSHMFYGEMIEVAISDFGMSKKLKAPDQKSHLGDLFKTSFGSSTNIYASIKPPEVESDLCGTASDIFAFGILMWQVLFRGERRLFNLPPETLGEFVAYEGEGGSEEVEVCIHFLKGRCRRMQTCKFNHQVSECPYCGRKLPAVMIAVSVHLEHCYTQNKNRNKVVSNKQDNDDSKVGSSSCGVGWMRSRIRQLNQKNRNGLLILLLSCLEKNHLNRPSAVNIHHALINLLDRLRTHMKAPKWAKDKEIDRVLFQKSLTHVPLHFKFKMGSRSIRPSDMFIGFDHAEEEEERPQEVFRNLEWHEETWFRPEEKIKE